MSVIRECFSYKEEEADVSSMARNQTQQSSFHNDRGHHNIDDMAYLFINRIREWLG